MALKGMLHSNLTPAKEQRRNWKYVLCFNLMSFSANLSVFKNREINNLSIPTISSRTNHLFTVIHRKK